MSSLTASIASRWSGVSRYGNAASNSRSQSVVRLERVAAPAPALGVEVEQLPGELLGCPARAGLDPVPARAAELGQRRLVAVGADVAGDLRQLVDRHEDLVVALELQVEVVAGDAADRLGVEPGEAGDAVVLVDDEVAGPQVGERAQQPASPARRPRGRPAAVDQPVLGDRGQPEARSDEAVAQARLLEDEPLLGPVPARLDAREVVGGALAPAAVRPGDERRVAGADELLELRLGLAEAAGGELGGLGAELERLRAGDRGEAERPAGAELGEDAVGLDVELVRVAVVERGAHVVPVVAQRGLGVLLGSEDHLRVVGQQVEQVAEVVERQQLGDVGALLRGVERGDLGQLAVLGRELGGGRDLDALGIAERALRERGEPAQRLDLVVEQVDADRALLGRGVDVEQPAADGELAAVIDLVHAFVPGGDEVVRGLVEVEQVAHREAEAVRAQRGVGHLLRQRDGGDDDHRRLRARASGRGPRPARRP